MRGKLVCRARAEGEGSCVAEWEVGWFLKVTTAIRFFEVGELECWSSWPIFTLGVRRYPRS